ncbi:MAG: hypothetical protein QME27_07795 [Syntrophaceae bacterium]|nr:hypothetical protein [Syntrophaceae bacterium]
MMKRHDCVRILLLATFFFCAVVWGPMNAYADDSSPYNLPKGVHIELDKEFYDALTDSHRTSTKIHSSDSSIVYLKLILKNQEEIIRKLDLLLQKQQ